MHYYVLHLRLYEANEIAFDLPLSDTFRAKKRHKVTTKRTRARKTAVYISSDNY